MHRSWEQAIGFVVGFTIVVGTAAWATSSVHLLFEPQFLVFLLSVRPISMDRHWAFQSPSLGQ